MDFLIPEAWFRGLSQGVLLLVGSVAVAALVKGADWLVDGASGIAYRAGISKVIVGATIVSLGTTSPECAVSVVAAWSGEPGLALGNAVGSIIVDSGLIFGLGCVLVALPADRFVLSRQGWVQFGAGVLLAIVCYGTWALSGSEATIGRGAGVMMLALLVGYLFLSVAWSQRHPAGEPFQIHQEPDASRRARGSLAFLLAVGLVGLMIVLLASRVLICSMSELAESHWHVPKLVIAASLVALGTSLPELVIGMTSIVKGHREILVGNVIGADILNVLFVVGASATAAPLPVVEKGASLPEVLLYVHLPTMLAILVLFRLFIFAASGRGRFHRWYGVPLLAIYVVYTVLQFVTSAGS